MQKRVHNEYCNSLTRSVLFYISFVSILNSRGLIESDLLYKCLNSTTISSLDLSSIFHLSLPSLCLKKIRLPSFGYHTPELRELSGCWKNWGWSTIYTWRNLCNWSEHQKVTKNTSLWESPHCSY